MTVELAVSKKKKTKKKEHKSIFTAQNVKSVLPFVDASLAILSNVKSARPYARALRAVTAVTAATLPDPVVEIIRKIATIRTQVIQLERSPASGRLNQSLRRLRMEQDAHIDLLIEQVKGN